MTDAIRRTLEVIVCSRCGRDADVVVGHDDRGPYQTQRDQDESPRMDWDVRHQSHRSCQATATVATIEAWKRSITNLEGAKN